MVRGQNADGVPHCEADPVSYLQQTKMHDYTPREKAKIAAGAVTAVVIVGWLAIVALALLSAG